MHGAAEQPDAPWRPVTDLLADPAALDARVAFVHSTLLAGGQPVPERVAASVTQLGLIARLLAPALAAEATGTGPVDLRADALWWQSDLGGVYALSVSTVSTVSTVPTASLDGSAVQALTDLIAERYAVPPKALWGNLASAVNSAAHQIALARPELSIAARAAADRLLADPRIEDGALRSGPSFRRRSCCLIYQAAGTRVAVCGDCVLGRGTSAAPRSRTESIEISRLE